jgi:cob(I)alamin adenosyltransferase
MLNYNETIKAMRELSRDQLRLTMTASTRAEIYSIERAKEQTEKHLEKGIKDIAIADFKLSQINDLDPSKDEQIVHITENKKSMAKYIERLKEEIAHYNEEIEKSETFIMEVQEGKIKVSAEKLNLITETLISQTIAKAAELIK